MYTLLKVLILNKKVQINVALAMTEWVDKWERNDWKTSQGMDVKNQKDIIRLRDLTKQVNVKWVRNTNLIVCSCSHFCEVVHNRFYYGVASPHVGIYLRSLLNTCSSYSTILHKNEFKAINRLCISVIVFTWYTIHHYN